MKKFYSILKWTGISFFSILLFWFIFGVVIINFVLSDKQIEQTIHNELDKAIKVKNGYSSAELTFLSTFPNFSIVLKDLYLIDTVQIPADTIFTSDKLTITLNTSTLIEKKIDIKKIDLLKPYLHYRIDTNGNTNIMQLISHNNGTSSQPIIDLNDLSVRKFSVKYDNFATSRFLYIKDANIGLKGQINTMDSIIDIRYGEIYIGKNTIEFKGHTNNNETDIRLSYNCNNITGICDYLYEYTGNKDYKNTKINGHYYGEIHAKGLCGDIGYDCMKIEGKANGENINLITPNSDMIAKDGEFDIDFSLDLTHEDSLRINVNSFTLNGDNLFIETNGNITHRDNDYQINAHVNSKGNLTKLLNNTSYLKKGTSIKGKYDLYVNVSSSLDTLLHNYSFPKDVNSLTSNIKIPNIFGHAEVDDFVFMNKNIYVSSNNLRTYFDGSKDAILTLKCNNLIFKTTDYYVTSQKSDISTNCLTMKSHIDINQLGIVNKKGTDTTSIQVDKIDLDVTPKEKKVLSGNIEKINLHKGNNNIFGAKIFVEMLNSRNKRNKNPRFMDAIESKIFILNFQNKDITAYGKIVKGECSFKSNNVSNLAVTADSADIKIPRNELLINNLSLIKDNESYDIATGKIQSKKLDFEIPLLVNGVKANYTNNNINFTTGPVSFGESDIIVNGNVSLKDKSKPKIVANISGQHLNINQIMYASNVHALAAGNPNAIPLNIIPKGGMPRGICNEKNDVRLNLDLKVLTLSSLKLDNAKGSINIKGNEILLNNITSNKESSSFQLSTIYKYVNPDYSTTTISLNSTNMSMQRLCEIIPDISKISPMLSALEGTADFNICMLNPVHKVITLDINKSKIAASLRTRRLLINDNESLAKVAKLLMFKNKSKTEIDSLAVAAKIENGQVTIFPFMLQVDRYKLALGGTSDLVTEEIDYHLSILKSPIPFKFGIDISGNKSPYKIQVVKTQYKTLDPSIMPWTEPEYYSFREKLYSPISDFRNRYKL